MKRKYIILLSIIGIPILLAYLLYGREHKVCNTRVQIFESGYYENISIISNRIYFFDKEEFAEQLILKIADNSLKDVRFSYDIRGYPNGLYITVYKSNYSFKNGNSSFRISYLQDLGHDFEYNIKDNSEKFVLEIIQ